MRLLASLAACVLVLAAPRAASAMSMELRGDQLVVEGRIVPEDGVRFRAIVESHPEITTVVLWNSPGGSALANDAITDAIEAHALNTVVSGFCVSACAMIFLAGKERTFGDLEPVARASLGFHGSYVRGRLAADRRLNALKARVMERTGAKADPALVDRWLHLEERSTIRFRYPGDARPDAPETYFCPTVRGANAGDFAACEPIAGTDALAAGIVTSTRVAHVNR